MRNIFFLFQLDYFLLDYKYSYWGAALNSVKKKIPVYLILIKCKRLRF